MKVQVLGDLRLDDVEVARVLPASKPRKVLALLLLNWNRVVPRELLVEEVWGHAPPPGAATALQDHVVRVRELLAGLSRGGEQLLVAEENGYQLRVDPDDHDLSLFLRQAEDGDRKLEHADHAGASRALRSALALWRGSALADVEAGNVVEPRVLSLEQRRLTALEQCVDAELQLGRHRELLAELTALVAQFPLNERVHAQFMVALHRSGRGAEALAVFRRLRDDVVRELGVEPSPSVQRLRQAILAADPTLETVPNPQRKLLFSRATRMFDPTR
ncbi:AfsR/SARP family transcriptional regulator [Streptoalloteichus hindustanus]|uniref:DNA-binding transcriptional activator of the SARP family n=1 Tax=Streptoalloteichus hindustanus TaxID=2017 RepID=A0A1M5NYZ3_STRHI|nr:AfsR/SARP family transcriptional regulator [Streptoalloteichus hindustanus]SHG94760.1 DNA-binding transcriptional activator of the SARP family [Streptoalloteichus hindustanus]